MSLKHNVWGKFTLIVMEVCVVHCTMLKRWILWFWHILSPSTGFNLMDKTYPPKQWGALIFAKNLHLQITLHRSLSNTSI